MATIIKGGLIQAANVKAPTADAAKMDKKAVKKELSEIKEAMVRKHIKLTEEAATQGVQVLCYQELFNGPYFCAEHDQRWYDFAESIPGPTVERFQEVAREHGMVLIVPIYELAMTGVYYNSAAVIDADGKYLGTYRKNHIPYVHPGFYEKYYFKPGNLGYPVFETAVGTIGVYICYDRHFPEGARLLGLRGAWIIFNPSATIEGVSKYLWELEQPAHAVANGYFVGAINRVGTEAPWNTGKFYGSSYFCDPRGKIIAQGSESRDEVVVADLDIDMVKEVRDAWQFYRDRRPDTYCDMIKQLP
jgi:N-carbamoylputrescine amidase